MSGATTWSGHMSRHPAGIRPTAPSRPIRAISSGSARSQGTSRMPSGPSAGITTLAYVLRYASTWTVTGRRIAIAAALSFLLIGVGAGQAWLLESAAGGVVSISCR
ncbi:hypothetical protein BJX61DRAFT_38806 [Aspergillus egyptiacus]|nr:hypothetical protein BJX61DRAFT_38806 [Aspergillus egyptiacus]